MATVVTKTIRASGGDYTSLSAFDAALPNLVTEDEKWVAECYDDWPSGLVDSVQFINITTSRANDQIVVVSVPDGERHNADQTGFFMTGYIRIANIDIDVSGVRLTGNTGFNNAKIDLAAHSTGFANLDSLVLHDSTVYGIRHDSGKTGWQCTNSLFDSVTWATYHSSPSSALFANNTVVNCGMYGIIRVNAQNCISYGHTTADYLQGHSSSTNNASSDASAPGSNSVENITSSEFEDYSSSDYHLDSASQLIGAGTNLYTDFTHDMDGDEWPSSGAWDIGFDYYVAAGGTITGTGTPQATEATSSGAGLILIAGSGSPQAETATANGTGQVGNAVSGSGSPSANPATSNSAGLILIQGNGAPQAETSTSTAVGIALISGVGSPQSDTATSSGTGQAGNTVSGSGATQAEPATSVGVGLTLIIGTGSGQSNTATASGDGEIIGAVSGSGTATSQTANSTGVGLILIAGSGSSGAETATASGYDIATTIHPGRVYTAEAENRVYTVGAGDRIYNVG